MKKRNFLIPVATLLSALSASNVDASHDNSPQTLANDNASISTLVSIANNPFEFVMQQVRCDSAIIDVKQLPDIRVFVRT